MSFIEWRLHALRIAPVTLCMQYNMYIRIAPVSEKMQREIHTYRIGVYHLLSPSVVLRSCTTLFHSGQKLNHIEKNFINISQTYMNLRYLNTIMPEHS